MNPWSEQEDKLLAELRKQGFTRRAIADRIPSRSYSSVKCRITWLATTPEQRDNRNATKRAYRRRWTEREKAIALELVRKKATDAECMAAIGRNYRACYLKTERLIHYPARWLRFPVEQKISLPDSVIEDRNRRLMAKYEMSLTGIICGDPEPGRARL